MKNKKIFIGFIATVALIVVIMFVKSEQSGYIEIDAGGAEINLTLRSGWFNSKTLITSADKALKVRAGIYQPSLITLTMEKNGAKWKVESRYPSGKIGQIKVKKDETIILKLGPPFTVKATVKHKDNFSQIITIDPLIIGQAGEQWQTTVFKNNKKLGAPKFKIVDEDEKVLVSGKFEYG